MCNTCNCNKKESNPCFDTCCEETQACDKPISTNCIFYNLENQENSKLFKLKLGNGTPLTTVVNLIDAELNKVETPNFKAFSLSYLENYNIKTIKQFSESVSTELGSLNSKIVSFTNIAKDNKLDIDGLSIDVKNLKYPKINDTAIAGFTTNSDLKTVLQKMNDKMSTLGGASSSPSINTVESSTVKITKSGIQGHTLQAVVKKSGASGNALQVNSDGLYVPIPTQTNQYQTLQLSGNALSITNGNSVTLPTATLVLTGSTLGIVGSSTTVNLASIVNTAQTQITVNNVPITGVSLAASGPNTHTLSASIVRSGDVNNLVELKADGLYIPPTPAQTILNEILATALGSSLRSSFCTIQNTSCKPPYRFYIRNTSGSVTLNFDYVHKDTGTTILPIAPSSYAIVSGVERINTLPLPSNNIEIVFLGV